MSQIPPTYPSNPPAFPEPQATSGLATAAMVLGIIGLLTSCLGIGVVLGLVAVILGIVALNQISSEGNRVGGRGRAISGIVLGTIAMCMIVVTLLIAILLPALGAARRTARQMTNNTQVRGIGQAMVIYSENNNGYYPGMQTDNAGRASVTDATVQGRFWTLLQRNYFTGEYAVSPSESLTVWTPGMPLTTANYSYALLQMATPGGRQSEWGNTLNSEAIVITDRNAGTPNDVFSIHTQSGGGWRGSVAYNDNHVNFELSHILQTKYGVGYPNNSDDLFQAAGSDDAWMIHSGDGTEVER